MPTKIETDHILRERQNQMENSAEGSNAEYVTQLEKTSSLMPPEKPFETEAAQSKVKLKEETDTSRSEEFVQDIKENTNDIERIDKTNETKLFLLNSEYKKLTDRLKDGSIPAKEKANLESTLEDVQGKITLYKSKLSAGASSSKSNVLNLEEEGTDEDGLGGGILDGLKDQVLAGVTGLIGAKKEEEEEEEEEISEKEVDQ